LCFAYPRAEDGAGENFALMEKALRDVVPLRYEEVSGQLKSRQWNALMREHHYLGYGHSVGCLKYLIYSRTGELLSLTGWSAAVWKLRSRDRAIGWGVKERRHCLGRVANNSRFLILPEVKIAHLASHLLARHVPILARDWATHYGEPLVLLETFVDGARFSGASYRAANWIHVGTTKGYARQGGEFRYHGKPKEVYLYAVTKTFHKDLGCARAPEVSLRHDYLSFLPKIVTRGERMKLELMQWNKTCPAPMNLSEDDLSELMKELNAYHALYGDCFGRVEHGPLSQMYLQGLLSNLPRKSVEPMAITISGESRVTGLQKFIGTGVWEVEVLAAKHRQEAARTVADEDGVWSLDGSDFPKKGKESVGVARQYCGRLGKIDNCQAGVFLAYSSPKGYALLDRRLFLPEDWFSNEQKERWQKCRIPEGTTFKTKWSLALAMLEQAVGSGLFPGRWVTGDDAYGMIPEFRRNLPKGLLCLLDIPCDTRVWTKRPATYVPQGSGKGRPFQKEQVKPGQPKPKEVSDLAKDPSLLWKKVTINEGSKGPIRAEVARLRVVEAYGNFPGEELWVFFRRSLADGQVKYAFSNAPADTPLEEMVRVSGLRWPIEQCFQEGKGEIGMDHYEHRSWDAWHRHMTFVFIAQLFLLRMRHHFKKKSILDAAAGGLPDEGCLAVSNV
jgi:SRSO17 transposase